MGPPIILKCLLHLYLDEIDRRHALRTDDFTVLIHLLEEFEDILAAAALVFVDRHLPYFPLSPRFEAGAHLFSQFLQGFAFDLPHPFPREIEVISNLLKGQ